MERPVNVWKANLTNGLILGLIGIIFNLVLYFLDLSLNKNMGWIFSVLLIGLIFYFIKSYRDNYLHGYITFGQAVGAGVVICFYYAIISALFTYVLYTYIDPGLSEKLLIQSEELLIKRGTPESAIGPALEMMKKFQKPWIIAISTIFNTMIMGTIISLIVSIFIKREGNPLLDDPSIQ